ncbi:uncharacterized protein EDB93DRAFT_707747 [Suillus bovinus]|uniref:uncharacterized protein n=1 Tax=Suillus bovinus TaxID=48563 RepID=UPI001B8645BE|nr:uncharacterized protein EDB93DRAFT_707747 [Suillus bovinus]KAG2139108.1 hypothetical protein EDB93DRAFT_707747 [Suillus bovinus]
MDLLWAEIEELEPLLGCVTRLHPLIYHSGTRWDKPWAKGVEPLSAHETGRQFMHHSSRIRTLSIQSDHPHLLSVIPAGACIFPRLRSLNVSTTYLDLFFPYTVLHRWKTVNEGLQSFVIPCIALEHLFIYTPEKGDFTSDLSLLSNRIRWCTRRLVTVSCPMLDLETWKGLSYIPALLTLRIDQGCNDPPSLLIRDLSLSPFLNITALSFRQLYDAADIITVMQHSQFPSLKEFEFEANRLCSEEAEQLFRALSHCKACQTLEKISICSLDDEFLEPPDDSLTPIPHFLCFTQLRDLELRFSNSCIYLDNAILFQAMSSWPHIHTLEIVGSGIPCSVSLHGLFTALFLCPHLHTLRVTINNATIDIDPDSEPIQHTSLRRLALETSKFRLEDAKTLARIISAWLPCVDQVRGFSRNWDEVNMHLRSLRAAGALCIAEA